MPSGTQKIRKMTPQRVPKWTPKGLQNHTFWLPADIELDMVFIVFEPHRAILGGSRKASEIQSPSGTPSEPDFSVFGAILGSIWEAIWGHFRYFLGSDFRSDFGADFGALSGRKRHRSRAALERNSDPESDSEIEKKTSHAS